MSTSTQRSKDIHSLRTLGILGGMSPESTADYYQRINLGVRQALGGHHSAQLMIFSANLAQFFDWLAREDDDALTDYLVAAASSLEGAGAEAILMACNTAHKVAPRIEDALGIPFIHIADVLATGVHRAGLSKLGLLGSQITVESSFYRERLRQAHGVEAIVSGRADRQEVDRVIREELSFHTIRPSSRETLERIAERLKLQGAEAIALACTELVLLVDGPELAGLPVFDSTTLHTDEAVRWILGQARDARDRTAEPMLAAAT